MNYRVVDIGKRGRNIQRFFQGITDPTCVQLQGKTLCVLYPMASLSYIPEGSLQDAQGGWDSLPEDVLRAMEQGNT